jgi:aspartate aminotransferase
MEFKNNFATKIEKVKESPTFAILAKANKMKQSEMDVVILATGEPDFDTPEFIKQAAIDAIISGKTKYTPVKGISELLAAVCNKFRTENNLNYELDEVIVSSGGKQAIYNLLQVIINSGDEVIIPSPYWVSYPDMVTLADGVPVLLASDINDNFKLTAEKLSKAITNKTKAIILNSPNNPTGMVYSQEELLAIANVLKQHPQIYIISDDLYEHLLFSDEQFINIANVMPNDLHRIIIINGVSKAYCMTGWRIGYAACKNKQLIKNMEIIQSQSTSNPCSISQYAALSALSHGIEWIKPMKEDFIKRHDYVYARLNKIKGIKVIPASGAFYSFFDCTEAIEKLYKEKKISQQNDLAFTNYLLDKFLLAGVAGSAFGLENHMRFSFATNMEQLKKAIDRLEEALDS